MDAIEQGMRAYAGVDYAKPRSVEAGCLDFFDFDGVAVDQIVERVKAFAELSEGLRLKYEFDWGGGEYSGHARITAYRQETAAETSDRIKGYRKEAARHIAERRAEYERLKREFGG